MSLNEVQMNPCKDNGAIVGTILPDKKSCLNFCGRNTFNNISDLKKKINLPDELILGHIHSVTTDIRFTLFCCLFPKVLPLWCSGTILILLAVLYSSPDGGFPIFIFTIIWLAIFFIGLYGCIITRKFLRLGLAQCVMEANLKLMKNNLLLYVNDCGDSLCIKYGLVFIRYNLSECHSDTMKLIRIHNANQPIKIDIEEASIDKLATKYLTKHVQEYMKAVFKGRLLFPRSPREGVSEFSPKHNATSWCLCQYVEKFQFNKQSKSILDYFI